MGNEQEISISKLHFHLSNPRCLFVETEEDALYELLLDQGGDKRTNKMVPLAKSIAEKGWSPTELLIVSPSKTEEDAYIVMEGNRRLAALKCLDQPDLLPSAFPHVKDEFVKLSPPTIFAVRCYITEDQAEINDLIERRHNGQSGGAGTIPWNTEQRARFMEQASGKSDKIVQLIEYLHAVFGSGSQEEIWLSKCKKTSLTRLFNSPYVREKLGFDLVNSMYVAVSPNLRVLSRFLERVSEASVGDIYDVKRRKAFIDEILNELGIDPAENEPEIDFGDTGCGNPGGHDGGDSPGNSEPAHSSDVTEDVGEDEDEDESGGSRPKGYSFDRRTVAPREGAPLPTQGEANLAQIHHELKRLNAEEAPIACALLLRALITLSTDAYLRKKLSADDYKGLNSKYAARIERACNELVGDDACILGNNDVDYMRKFAQNKDKLPVTLSSLHSPAHGSNGWPDGASLIGLWDKTYKVIREMLSYTPK